MVVKRARDEVLDLVAIALSLLVGLGIMLVLLERADAATSTRWLVAAPFVALFVLVTAIAVAIHREGDAS